MTEFSEGYYRTLENYKAFHGKHKTCGGGLMKVHHTRIHEMIRRLDAKTVLDYGCGKGVQYKWRNKETGKTLEQTWGLTVAKYDPAWPEYAAEPVGTFDLVICTHTLSHIPVSDVDAVVDRLYSLADKGIYVGEQLIPWQEDKPPKKVRIFPKDIGAPPLLTTAEWVRLLFRDKAIEVVFVEKREDRTKHMTVVREAHPNYFSTSHSP